MFSVLSCLLAADDVFVFVAEPESADLSRFELSHVSSLVKKFLAHLPNPVIPVQVYDEMLALAEGTCFYLLGISND